jgi:hypothetical protein
MDIAQQLIGKPMVFYAKGKKRQIGTITGAETQDNALQFTASVTDAEVAKLLHADIEGAPSAIRD